MQLVKTYQQLEKELEDLRSQLEEANDILESIRTGGVDALVVKNEEGHQLYTLKSADQTYRVFIEKMNEGAVTLNREGLILYSNSRFAALVCLPLSKVIGLQFNKLVPAENKNMFDELISNGWEHDTKGEISLLKSDGSLVPFLISLTTLELDEGTALSIILADLSAQKETQRLLKLKNEELLYAQAITENLNIELESKVGERTRELLISREHFKFLAENIPVIVWSALPNGDINYFNKRWYEYTGMDEAVSINWGWQSVLHPDDRQATLDAWRYSISTGNRFQVECRMKKAVENIYRWHFVHAVPFKNDKGQIMGWFGICTDIDHQKKTLEEKDEFISMASHELKTPVTTLKGFTQLLLASFKEDGNEQARNALRIMDNQITKLTRLITDLLDATKLNAGQMKYEEQLFDLNNLLQETVYEMQLTTDDHLIKTELAEPQMVKADRNRIGQVLANLISNAIKYSQKGSDIVVSSINKNGKVQCCVQDFGIGIPREKHSKLFTRFFRVSDDKTNTFPGMGLGLYISMGIIKKHHGNIWLESEVGRGSKFYFSLWIDKASARTAQNG